MTAGQDSQIFPDLEVLHTHTASLEVYFVSRDKLLGWNILEERSRQATVPPLPSPVIDTLNQQQYQDNVENNYDGEEIRTIRSDQ